ncbi:hypothetical protein ACFP1I_02210 [Dyadobacter subterraneus]|uniref:Uncharacterized protein n=1 Tax=Dyadobacter subterraneus TaxID=2773304 RepID=A0ABR9W9H0_9BACT|nr:hypothetical protein [Dyadobacter subterraneus]MBE9461566.1 hypothetical protein [Dyadobacter subterraneus]
MIRILSILLFGLLLYNAVGYSVVYLCESNHTISSKKQNYIETNAYSQDIVIKIPVPLPYQTNWKSSETVEGVIQHNGNYYQIKTRQLINDTLYVHCELDQNARERFSSLVSNIINEVRGMPSDPHKTSHATILKNFVKEYLSLDRKHTFYLLEWSETAVLAKDHYVYHASKTHRRILSPPPELA